MAYLFSGDGKRRVEPLLEGVASSEDRRQQEVEEGPELRQLVLKRRAGQQEPVVGRVVRVQDLSQLAVVVLHSVALVDDHVLPTNLETKRNRTHLVARLSLLQCPQITWNDNF